MCETIQKPKMDFIYLFDASNDPSKSQGKWILIFFMECVATHASFQSSLFPQIGGPMVIIGISMGEKTKLIFRVHCAKRHHFTPYFWIQRLTKLKRQANSCSFVMNIQNFLIVTLLFTRETLAFRINTRMETLRLITCCQRILSKLKSLNVSIWKKSSRSEYRV